MKRPPRILGLVPGRSYDALMEQHSKAEARAGRLAQQLEETKADSRGWKGKTEEATSALKKAQDAAATAQKQLRQAEKQRDEQSRNARKLKDESDKLRKLQEARAAELALLKQRLAESERDLIVAREQLMAIEVKLDILEGAANVLDGRTRDIATRRSGGVGTESGSAV
jgi:chromosome segregation ATPase